jgi:hypothetical protein
MVLETMRIAVNSLPQGSRVGHRSEQFVRSPCEHVFVRTRPADPHSYAYLLGAYVGDGYVANTGRSFQLVITLDAVYPDIVEECGPRSF